MLKLVVFASGRGSNFQAIVNSPLLAGKIEIKLLVSDKLECGAIDFAREYKIPVLSVRQNVEQGFVDYSEALKIIEGITPDLIVLAGFLKLIPLEYIQKFPKRIINIHPALLPAFGGKGMYGMRVHQAVFNSSVKVSGPTVHFVDENYDCGLIIAQKAVDISDVRNPEEISQRVLKLEHELYPEVIKAFIDNRVSVRDNRVYLI